MGFSNSCLPSTLVAAFLLATANGHGYMTEPAVTFLSSSTDNTQFIATIESSASGFSGTFSGSPADNTAAFTTAFDSSSYTSLKDLINSLATVTVMGATLTCGSCDPDETAQPLPAEYVEWSHSSTEGFTASHEGPCEVWCDDVRVFHDADCAADYTSAPAELPYDRDACLGTSTLTFYWLALHSSMWQVYVNCAPLETTTSTGATSKYAVGASSGTSTTTSNSTSSTTSVTSTPSTVATVSGSAATSVSTSTTSSTTAPTTASSTSTTTTSTTAAPSTSSTSTATSTTVSPSTSSPSTAAAGSSGTSNQWTSTNSTGSTKANGGWSTPSTAGSTGTTQKQWSNNSDVQSTTGTVSPNRGTASGWNNSGWGNSFGFRH